jgi:hypothetical protein
MTWSVHLSHVFFVTVIKIPDLIIPMCKDGSFVMNVVMVVVVMLVDGDAW